MHPAIGYEIVKARIAEDRRRAEQGTLAQVARAARSARTPRHTRPAARLARRVLAPLTGHGRLALRTQTQPLPTSQSPAPGSAGP